MVYLPGAWKLKMVYLPGKTEKLRNVVPCHMHPVLPAWKMVYLPGAELVEVTSLWTLQTFGSEVQKLCK